MPSRRTAIIVRVFITWLHKKMISNVRERIPKQTYRYAGDVLTLMCSSESCIESSSLSELSAGFIWT